MNGRQLSKELRPFFFSSAGFKGEQKPLGFGASAIVASGGWENHTVARNEDRDAIGRTRRSGSPGGVRIAGGFKSKIAIRKSVAGRDDAQMLPDL